MGHCSTACSASSLAVVLNSPIEWSSVEEGTSIPYYTLDTRIPCSLCYNKFMSAIEEAREEARATRQDVNAMRSEMREGFASLKAHDYAQHRDIEQMERRIADLEIQVDRLNTAQGLERPGDER